jgi:hypothetical protein
MVYSLAELARAAGLSERTLRRYVASGIMPNTARYGEEQLYVACAAKALSKRGQKPTAIKRQLAGASDAEVCAIAGLPAPPRMIDPAEIERAHRANAAGSARRPAPQSRAHQSWTRVSLCPGVELHVSGAADEEALRVAREIEAIYALR